MARGDSTFQLAIILFLLLLTCQLLEAQRSNSSAGNLTVGCAEMEREALLKFKEDLIDLSGWLSSWVGDDCCNWVGVACHNQTGNVLSIDLKSPDVCEAFQDNEAAPYNKSCLSGTLSPSLLNLTYLNYLDLSHNGFYETPIPEFIGSLKNLRYLDLSLASFTGMVPPSLGNLSNLQYLDLSNGFSSGKLWVTDLNWLSGLSSLQYLHLTGTNLSMSTTDWLPAINMLPSLLELELGGCGLNNIHYSLPFINFTSLSTLDLSGNNFNSPIPQWLFNISSLSDVVISLSELSGSIPIVPRGNMCNLRTLDLSHNDINGDIEEFIEALSGCNNSTLRWFDSSSNKLGGRLPDSIGSFEYLYWLDLSNNSFLGPLPTSIGNLSRLGKLDLSFNKMSGAIPENIGQLSVVHQLNVHGNSWEGVITENHLQNLTRLRDFSLSSKGNALVFNVEANWIAPFSLLSLALSGCQLPAFPSWLITQVRLSELTISSASISDNIPDWFWRLLPNIWWLDLSHNKLRGELPHTVSVSHEAWINLGFNRLEGSLPLWPNVTYLYLRNNFLTGPIPSNIGHEMSSLRNLDLSRNLLNGSIPLSMTEMRNLSSLDFSNNYLSGEIPSNWHGLERLMFLDLSNNTLSGGIPSSTCSQPSLMSLKLNSNNLSGELSTTLQNCAPLALLDLGENKFFGSIPVAENMLYLSYLRLRANMLTGNIPEEICQFPNLHILDLAHNNLSGSIPKCLGSLKAFKYKAILFELPPSATQIPSSLHVELVLKGREDEYTTIFPLVNLIDLSSNNLTGEIPKEITNLSFMGTLNLSWNQLTGKIPENIGSLQQLETLDFSWNHLSGPIPPSMTSISFLNHLNLSYNNFSGQIPSTGQLQSLLEPSMYEGNPYLCGPPLTTNCSSGQGHGEDKDTEIQDEDESEKFWFFISMGLGFIVGFWAVCGSLMVKKSWRYAYFRFLDEMKDKLLLIIAIHVARLRKKLYLNDKENVQRGPE